MHSKKAHPFYIAKQQSAPVIEANKLLYQKYTGRHSQKWQDVGKEVVGKSRVNDYKISWNLHCHRHEHQRSLINLKERIAPPKLLFGQYITGTCRYVNCSHHRQHCVKKTVKQVPAHRNIGLTGQLKQIHKVLERRILYIQPRRISKKLVNRLKGVHKDKHNRQRHHDTDGDHIQ